MVPGKKVTVRSSIKNNNLFYNRNTATASTQIAGDMKKEFVYLLAFKNYAIKDNFNMAYKLNYQVRLNYIPFTDNSVWISSMAT